MSPIFAYGIPLLLLFILYTLIFVKNDHEERSRFGQFVHWLKNIPFENYQSPIGLKTLAMITGLIVIIASGVMLYQAYYLNEFVTTYARDGTVIKTSRATGERWRETPNGYRKMSN